MLSIARVPTLRSRRIGGISRGLLWCASYAVWVEIFRLLILTFVTYFVMSSQKNTPRFEEISEAVGSNELTLLGLAALLYVILLRFLHPITQTPPDEIFTADRIERGFVPGFFHGALLASGLILAFVISGLYRYLGLIVQFEDLHLALPGILLRALTLGTLVYCEELVFRHKMLNHLRGAPFSKPPMEQYFGPVGTEVASVLIVAVAYCAVKRLQFDLGVMQLLTLFLLSITVSLRTLTDGDFTRGAGFLVALLIVLHPLLSLPVFGNEFSGLVLIKYQAALDGSDAALDDAKFSVARFFTGGAGGPLSSFALQLLLILDIGRGILSRVGFSRQKTATK